MKETREKQGLRAEEREAMNSKHVHLGPVISENVHFRQQGSYEIIEDTLLFT